jgi:hypothetical protein
MTNESERYQQYLKEAIAHMKDARICLLNAYRYSEVKLVIEAADGKAKESIDYIKPFIIED